MTSSQGIPIFRVRGCLIKSREDGHRREGNGDNPAKRDMGGVSNIRHSFDIRCREELMGRESADDKWYILQ